MKPYRCALLALLVAAGTTTWLTAGADIIIVPGLGFPGIASSGYADAGLPAPGIGTRTWEQTALLFPDIDPVGATVAGSDESLAPAIASGEARETLAVEPNAVLAVAGWAEATVGGRLGVAAYSENVAIFNLFFASDAPFTLGFAGVASVEGVMAVDDDDFMTTGVEVALILDPAGVGETIASSAFDTDVVDAPFGATLDLGPGIYAFLARATAVGSAFDSTFAATGRASFDLVLSIPEPSTLPMLLLCAALGTRAGARGRRTARGDRGSTPGRCRGG